MSLRILHVGRQRVTFTFQGREQSFSPPAMLALAFVVGIIGGTYGIGGGAIVAPFCVALFRLPVYVVAGAALAGTFATSVAGMMTKPDWALGLGKLVHFLTRICRSPDSKLFRISFRHGAENLVSGRLTQSETWELVQVVTRITSSKPKG